MKTKMIIGAGAVAVVLAAGTAWAMGPGRHGGMMGHMLGSHVAEMEDYLDATPQQRQVIEAAKNDIVSALQAKAQAHKDAHGQIMDALTGDNFDENALYAFANARAQDVQELAKVIVPNLHKVHDVLTPAQRQKLAAKIQQRRQQHQQQGGFGGPPGE